MTVQPTAGVTATDASLYRTGREPFAARQQRAGEPSPGPEEAVPSAHKGHVHSRSSADSSLAVQQQISKLASRDREVRNHEQAHLAAAGALAQGVSYSLVTGPDNRQYAVGGEVKIDVSPVSGNPEATLAKAQQIKAAATAPAQPSSQDLAVSASASRMEAEASAELLQVHRQQQATAYRKGESYAVSGQNPGSLLSLLG